MAPGLSCSADMWDLSGPGIEPMSPALAGGFFTTEPPGKPPDPSFIQRMFAENVLCSWCDIEGPKYEEDNQYTLLLWR